VHVSKIVAQGLWNTIEHFLSKFEPISSCGSISNFAVFSSRLIPDICLTDDPFENLISSLFVRYCLCMSA
jgi:hypothetical protein